ncbi:MAG: CPBP family intramembrane glutamic endopeptidase [Bacteroidales bacterium]
MNLIRTSPYISGALVVAGTWVLGISVHRFPLLAFTGIVLSAAGIVLKAGSVGELLTISGLSSWNKKSIIYSIPGILTGLALAFFYSQAYGTNFLPATLMIQAIIAPLIGITEELIFRGYIQGIFKGFDGWFGILAGAGSHAVYKLLVIGSYPEEIGASLIYLFLFTLVAGILFGWMRKLAGNLLPAALAHAVFDLVIYGGLATLPGWVWY